MASERSTLAGRSYPALLVVALASGLLLFWNVQARYLWQDEAACAVMAERMLEHGKPLGYADGNLITMDVFRREDGAELPYETATPEGAIATFAARGDFKADTTWIGQPWGQFVFAGASFALFGRGTLQARLPFVLAAIATLVLLYDLVRRRFRDPWMAAIAVLLCLGSVYWFLHMRQCRYYGTATLFLLMTTAAYLRWQDGGRLGRVCFVTAAWLWFQNDFGSFWPVMLVLGLDSLRAARRDPARLRRALATFGILAALVLPFAWYYELWTRQKEPIAAFHERFFVTLYFQDQYQIPLVFLLAVALMGWRLRRVATPAEWHVVTLASVILGAELVFMTLVGPYGFYRYIVDCTPFAALVMAFVLVRSLSGLGRGAARIGSALGALVMLVTPWLAEPGRRLIPVPKNFQVTLPPAGTLVRGEWTAFALDLANTVPDPNKLTVEFLRAHLQPQDEVLINYEDIPLMFYLGNHVRGGIQCFRLDDLESPPPRYVLIRMRPRICHRSAYDEAFSRLAVRRLPFDAPDIPWGNNPDPSGHYSRWADDLGEMGLWECIGWR